jgi:NifU-like protein involved in Fe-S cluster formation
MCCEVKGMNILDAQSLAKKVIEFVEKDKEFSLIGDLVVYKTIVRFSERHDCSLLSWRGLVRCF